MEEYPAEFPAEEKKLYNLYLCSNSMKGRMRLLLLPCGGSHVYPAIFLLTVRKQTYNSWKSYLIASLRRRRVSLHAIELGRRRNSRDSFIWMINWAIPFPSDAGGNGRDFASG